MSGEKFFARVGDAVPANGSGEMKEGDTLRELPTPEEKGRNLTFEVLSNLSTEDYIELWRMLNPFYVTHITRQGIRDHNAMIYHSAGVGDYTEGFKSILGNGKCLKSPAEVAYGVPKNFDEKDVSEMLDKFLYENSEYEQYPPKTILDLLPFNNTVASANAWDSINAIHFAQHTVLDEIYGGEKGNEIFFVFPTDLIASQCQFGGHAYSLANSSTKTDRKWNDLFVWSENGEIPLDAGLVFIPENQLVDKETGSKYDLKIETDENGGVNYACQKDEERIKRFSDWIKNLSEGSPEYIAYLEGDMESLKEKLDEIGIPEQCQDMFDAFGDYDLKLFMKNGFLGDRWDLPSDLQDEELLDYSIKHCLEMELADLKLSDNVVTSKEYWENYFNAYQDERPKHIIYYNGDPSTAVKEFLMSNGIMKELEQDDYGVPMAERKNMTGPGDSVDRDGKWLGFDSHNLTGNDNVYSKDEQDRFNEIALKILEKRQRLRDSNEK